KADAFSCSPACPLMTLSGLRQRYIETIQGDGDETIKAHQIDELGSTMLAECLNGLTVGQLGQRAMINKRRSHVIGDRLFARQVAWTLTGHDGRDLVVGKSALLGPQDMGIDLIGGTEFCAGDQDRNLSDRFRQ